MVLIIKTKKKNEGDTVLYSAMIKGRKTKLLSKVAKENFINSLLSKR